MPKPVSRVPSSLTHPQHPTARKPPQAPSAASMPEPDKRASAQQAVDILHEISTLL
ncbi:hypothetical protein E4U53_002165, partial [Claviceps sorghi]